MHKPIIYITNELRVEHITTLKNNFPDYLFIISPEQPSEEDIDHIEIMLGWNERIGNAILNHQKNRLKWIQTNSAGVDYLPLDKIKEQGIIVSNMSGIHAVPIAETVIGLLLAYYRGIQDSIKAQINKTWLDSSTLKYDSLSSKKMLIIGAGKIGQELARLAQAFNIEVDGVNRSGLAAPFFKTIYQQDNLHEHLAKYDIIVNILPLTSDTINYYNKDFFKKTKCGVDFINVGRGKSVNESDLITYLDSGHVRFAGLDVFDVEPLLNSSPLWSMPQVIITPHISGLVSNFQNEIMRIYLANLISFTTNNTLAINSVDLESGY